MRQLLLVLALLLLTALPLAAESALTPRQQLDALGFLTGHWRSDTFEAIYSSPEGGMMLSISKSYREGWVQYGEFEQFSIEEGAVTLTPFPGGTRSAHAFPLVELDVTARRVVFENLAHDWPTHFIYECPTEDTLHIVVSGLDMDGEVSTLEFTLERVTD